MGNGGQVVAVGAVVDQDSLVRSGRRSTGYACTAIRHVTNNTGGRRGVGGKGASVLLATAGVLR